MNSRIRKLKEFDGHEDLKIFKDKKTGLVAVVAIHSTKIGPAAGATRYSGYKNINEAIKDALRLSRGMTYKAAMAGVPFGGGKAVIVKNPGKPKNKALLKEYGKFIESLNGIFYTGQDVGMTAKDVEHMSKFTGYVIGKKPESNNPPYWTARGVVRAMESALREVYGSKKFKDKVIGIKGLGNVGQATAEILYKAGAKLLISDVEESKLKKFIKLHPGTKILNYKEIHKQEMDVFCPCALSHDINHKTINQFKCKIICGAANNQLSDPVLGKELYNKNILYIPDYIANAGGMINVLAELEKGGYKKSRVEKKVDSIAKTVDLVIAVSKKEKKPTNLVADEMAQKRLSGIKN